MTGFGLGEDHWGGYAELASVRPEWIVRVPAGRDVRWAMSVGTAGLTAMLCVLALERHDLTPEAAGDHPIVVTGAAGGVGSVAVALLAELGYKVAAVSGRPEHEAYLRRLGAAEVVPAPSSPMLRHAPSTGSGGSGAWTPSAARRSPPSCARPVMADAWPPVALRAAPISRRPCIPSSCGA